MLSGSVDPRRPDKQQRYKPPAANNNAAPGEDLTPDYMNILDPQRKSMQTSCRSDRFKVVKIESTEPFKRGRWECMDFLDQSYNRIFQRNCNNNRQMSYDTHVSTLSANFQSELRRTLTNNSDLQSSMLHIFYRQNNNIFDSNNTLYLAQYQETVVQPCRKKYQNHVLRPGMVSSSLVGIKYPFELNFEKDESSPSKENCYKNRPATVSDCHAHCNNQKFQNMSSDYSNLPVYQNLTQDLLNNGKYNIENTVPQPQVFPEIYQEQIITYVDNFLPQQRITSNTTEVYTTLTPNFATEYNKNPNYVNIQPNIIYESNQEQLNQQLTQIIDTPVQNNVYEVPQILYHPNPRFKNDDIYLPVQTESQIQNKIIYENDQLSSVISTSSYENFPPSNEDLALQNLRPVLQEVFENQNLNQSNSVNQIVIPGQTNPLVMPIYTPQPGPSDPNRADVSSCVKSFLRDEQNIIACSNQSKGPQSIDAKIEQLMDLVKKHLKFAVLEDVNLMKQQILVLKGRVAQLEYENALLRSYEDRRHDDV